MLICLSTVFLLGVPVDPTAQASLASEQQQWGDIVQGTFTDTYRNLSYKALGCNFHGNANNLFGLTHLIVQSVVTERYGEAVGGRVLPPGRVRGKGGRRHVCGPARRAELHPPVPQPAVLHGGQVPAVRPGLARHPRHQEAQECGREVVRYLRGEQGR